MLLIIGGTFLLLVTPGEAGEIPPWLDYPYDGAHHRRPLGLTGLRYR